MTTELDTTTVVTAGVDTHRDVHMVAALDQRGAELGVQGFSTDPGGHRNMLDWLETFGPVELVGVEGTGTYGAGLTRFLHRNDIAHPKTRTGNVEAIRALRMVRRSATRDRTSAINQMRALVVTGPDDIRETFRGLTTKRLVSGAARLRPTDPTTVVGATKFALRELARRVQFLNAEIKRVNDILSPLITATAPELIARHGVGIETAATLLVTAGDNPNRLHSEAAFAHLCGSAPINASSGLVQRKRLNPRGDRLANEALWRIVMVRMSSEPRTRAYVQRRTIEGKSKREIIRCLKRYVSREVFKDLKHPLDNQ